MDCVSLPPPPPVRLIDVIFRGMELYLVFEYLDCDLKRYMDAAVDHPELALTPELMRVCGR